MQAFYEMAALYFIAETSSHTPLIASRHTLGRLDRMKLKVFIYSDL